MFRFKDSNIRKLTLKVGTGMEKHEQNLENSSLRHWDVACTIYCFFLDIPIETVCQPLLRGCNARGCSCHSSASGAALLQTSEERLSG